jgi:hypothetical protein
MTIRITNKEKDRIIFKSSDQTCTVLVDGKEIDGMIVGMSTNGTYIIESLDENCSPEEVKPRVMGADDSANDSFSK